VDSTSNFLLRSQLPKLRLHITLDRNQSKINQPSLVSGELLPQQYRMREWNLLLQRISRTH
jgi:hypothetical protein